MASQRPAGPGRTQPTAVSDLTKPQCQICSRAASSQLPFCCTGCSRNALYDARLKHAQMLLRKEALAREVERAVKDGQVLHDRQRTDSGNGGDAAARIAYDKAKADRVEAKSRMRATEHHIQTLTEEVRTTRDNIAARWAKLAERTENLEAGRSEMARQEGRRDPIKLSIGKTEAREDTLYRKTVHARTSLCQKTGSLYNLTRKKRRGEVDRDVFYIGELRMVDLQDLFNAKIEPLNASIVSIVYLLNQIASYLSLRLPAEMFLPSAENARPRILAPHSSYRQPSLSIDKQQPLSSSHSNTEASVHGWATSRPRTLCLDRPLTRLNADDNVAYENFVEALSLLAYNVVWLCKTQGLDVCKNSSEEACFVGRNLWLLLSEESESRSRILRRIMGEAWQEAAGDVKLGAFSHGTYRNFAAGVEGDEMGLKTWKLGNATQLIKKVKDVLLERKMGAEWELLEEDEWGLPEEGTTDAVPGGDAAHTTDTEGEKAVPDRGSKGWMRIRNRYGNAGEGPS